MESSVVSVRIKKELKDEANQTGLNLRKILEDAIAFRLQKQKMNEIKESANYIIKHMGVTKEEWMKSIRQTRDNM
jgi:antitoxin component of RelBE/YafQ-DinJ toxin-antitoxin module